MEKREIKSEPVYKKPVKNKIQVNFRQVYPRKVFWPIFLTIFIGFIFIIFVVLDRYYLYQEIEDILPENTTAVISINADYGDKQHQNLNQIIKKFPLTENYNLEEFMISNLNFFGNNTSWISEINKLAKRNHIIFTPVGQAVAFSSDFQSNLSLESVDLIYRNEKLKELRLANSLSSVYVWSKGGIVYLSSEIPVLKLFIDTYKDQQKTIEGRWFYTAEKKSLNTSENYQKLYNALDNHYLVKGYVNPEAAESLNLEEKTNKVIKRQIPKYISDLLSFAGKDKVSFPNNINYSFLLKANKNNLEVHVKKEDENTYKKNVITLASLFPKEIDQIPLDLYIEMAEFNTNTFSDLQINYLDGLFGEFTKEEEKIINQLSDHMAVATGLSDSGEPLIIFIARHNHERKARDLSSLLASQLKRFSKNSSFRVLDNYLIVSTSPMAVLEVSRNIETIKDNLNKQININNSVNQVFYLKTISLVNWGKLLTAADKEESSDIWQALENLTELIPSITITDRFNNGVTDTEIIVKMQEVSDFSKNQIEKYFSRLNIANKASAAAIRDAQRLADISVIRGGLISYYQNQNQYPYQLEELLPIYLLNIPHDPLENKSYQYHNKDSDHSFVLEFNLETESELGKPGLYCLNSQIIEGPTNNCQEK